MVTARDMFRTFQDVLARTSPTVSGDVYPALNGTYSVFDSIPDRDCGDAGIRALHCMCDVPTR